MDIRRLQTLIAIAESGSFAAAADRVGLTQSAVSQQVRAMELQIGVQLFDRTIRPPRLNVHGLQLLEAARRIVQSAEAAMDAITGSRMTGTFAIGAVRSAIFGLLPRALGALKATYPDLRIRVVSGRTADFLSDVAAGRLDAAIITDSLEVPADLRWYPYIREPLYAIAPPGTSGETAKELLEGQPFVRFHPSVPLAQLIDGEIARLGIRVIPNMEIDTIHAIVLIVANGLGVSIVPHGAIFEPSTAPVRSIPFGPPPVHREVGFIERPIHPKKLVTEALHAELSRLAGGHGKSRT